AGVAHDFNNLLSVISLSNDIISQEVGQKLEVREEIKSIENAVQQGKGVVRSMLGYSRDLAEKPGEYAIADAVGETVSLLSKQFLGGIVLTMDVGADTPKVWGARGRLEQVLLNLVLNAAEAMKGQGRLLIAARMNGTMGQENLVLRPRPATQYIELSV